MLRRRALTHNGMLTEYVKLVVLAFLLLVVVYTGGLKIWLLRQAEQSLSIRQVGRDYDVCKSSVDRLDACKAAVDSAADAAQVSCNVYLVKEAQCYATKKRRNFCEAQTSATEGCISMVVAAQMKAAGF